MNTLKYSTLAEPDATRRCYCTSISTTAKTKIGLSYSLYPQPSGSESLSKSVHPF